MSTTSSSLPMPTITSAKVSVIDMTGEFALTATGVASAFATVSLFIDGILVGETKSGADGRYTEVIPVDTMGAHKLVAVASTDDGQSSAGYSGLAFNLGTANDPGAKDWGNFILASNGETFTTLNSRKEWSVSAPDGDTLRFEVHDRDVAYYDFITKAASERSEVRLVDEFSNGVPLSISYKFNVEPGSKNDSAWVVLGQLHQNDVAGAPAWSPPLEIGLIGERMVITVRYTGADGKPVARQVFTDTADIERGHFYDMDIKAVFDPDGNGRLVLIRDGVVIVDYAGKLGYVGHDGVYWQEGIYRHAGAVLPLAANYKDLTVVTGSAVEFPTADHPNVDDSPYGGVHVVTTVGVDALTLKASQDLVDPDTPVSTIELHWQSSANGTVWNDVPGGTAATLEPGGALAGLFLRALATYTDAYGVHSVVSDETVRFGASGDDMLTGTLGHDVLAGFAGNDTLDGRDGNDHLYGGYGNDILIGGAGDDTLFGDGGNDRLDGGDGADHLVGGAGADTLLGGNGADALFGGDGADQLYGGAGDDVLHGGAGDDFLHGGAGNDTLYGDVGADRLEGLTGDDTLWGGAGNDFLSGGDGNDRLYGEDGNDRLDGGLGADRMSGGAGDDTYIVDNVADVVVEIDNALGGGKDSVFASVSYTLGAYVEMLNLTGTGNIDGTGNNLGNRIIGNAGNNVLTGLGGQDTITGGGGADTFVFLTAGAGSKDRILDFSKAEGDKVGIDSAYFGFMKGHDLPADHFVSGANITQGTVAGEGQFLFDTTSHTLFWDADGAGNGAAVALASFDNANLTADDFLII